jgi:retron-type reverse transcriptase
LIPLYLHYIGDHTTRLMNVGRADLALRFSLHAVLANTGSRTAGIDGIRKKDLADDDARTRIITELQADLKTGHFKPRPVKRRSIPKADGKMRPLGIPNHSRPHRADAPQDAAGANLGK